MMIRNRRESQSRAERVVAGWLGAGFICLEALAGCSGGGGTQEPSMLSDASGLGAAGDRDDLDAAVEVGAERAEAVVVEMAVLPDGSRRYVLRTAINEPGVLVVGPVKPGPDPVEIRMQCSIGRFGDHAREERLMGYVRDRLKQLQGVGFAPIRR